MHNFDIVCNPYDTIYSDSKICVYSTMSQSSSSTASPSPSLRSGNEVTDLTSLSFTKPKILQAPRHKSVRVDWTESWFRRWESTILPLLKTRSTSTDVA